MSRRDIPEHRPEATTRPFAPPLPPAFTPLQRLRLAHWQQELQEADHWHGGLPVLILERCWLRLSAVAVQDLARRLPPDNSREAPELVRYRELLAIGHPPLEAEQLCWLEFGTEACRQAQHRLWDAQERGNHGWTLDRYLQLLRDYRHHFAVLQPRPLPLIVLARADEGGTAGLHRLVWLGAGDGDGGRSMRHTCA